MEHWHVNHFFNHLKSKKHDKFKRKIDNRTTGLFAP
jgi:hypothetical protein